MIDCPNGEIRDLLPEFIHGTLPVEIYRQVERHVTECVACTEEVALLRNLGIALAPATSVDVAAIVAALPAPPAPRPRLVRDADTPRAPERRRPVYAQRWLQYAAGLVLVAGLGTYAVNRTGLVDTGPATVAARTTGDDGGFAVVAVESDLNEAELRGLLEEIDKLESAPAEESEGVVRDVPESESDL